MGLLQMIGLRPSRGVTGLLDDRTSTLKSIVWSDLLGQEILESLPLTRDEAITVPAVSKARNLLVSTIAPWTLKALGTVEVPAGGDGTVRVVDSSPAGVEALAEEAGEFARQTVEVPTQPSFLYRTNGAENPYQRMTWTIDDGIFYGVSLWTVLRGAKPQGQMYGPILFAERVPFEWWEIRALDGEYRVFLAPGGDWAEAGPLADDTYLLFDFPFEGLLNVGRRTVRGAVSQERAWVGRALNPIPLVDLHRTAEAELQDDEVDKMVDDWAAGRTSVNGAIGSTPPGIELKVYGEVSADLMVEGRNAVRTDVGSFLNIRASMLDGTQGIDSLTYTTNEGEKNAFYEIDLPFWTAPIEWRLSQDDVVPRGQRVRFEKYQSTPTPTGPVQED